VQRCLGALALNDFLPQLGIGGPQRRGALLNARFQFISRLSQGCFRLLAFGDFTVQFGIGLLESGRLCTDLGEEASVLDGNGRLRRKQAEELTVLGSEGLPGSAVVEDNYLDEAIVVQEGLAENGGRPGVLDEQGVRIR
jgi:hypothetical protein